MDGQTDRPVLTQFFSLFQAAETHKLSDKWTEIEFALNMLGITPDEAKAIWSTLAAIYHLGGAGITMGRYPEATSGLIRERHNKLYST